MNLDELVDLVTLRNYTANVTNSNHIDKTAVKDLTAALVLLDKKIIEIMRTQEFKDYLGLEDSQKIIQEHFLAPNKQNNIKSSMR